MPQKFLLKNQHFLTVKLPPFCEYLVMEKTGEIIPDDFLQVASR